MIQTVAFLYKWIHIPTGKWYVGSRTARGCNPKDGYICSSKTVKPLILENTIDWYREILVIGEPSYIRTLESQYLAEFDAKNNSMSFNNNNADGKFTTTGKIESEEAKIRRSAKMIGKKRTDAQKENYRKANQAKAKNPEYLAKLRKPKPQGHGEKVSQALKGIPKTEEHKIAMSVARKGKLTGPCSDTRKEAIRQALKGKHTLPLVTCPHCGLEGRSNMQRWHFDNCRKKV